MLYLINFWCSTLHLMKSAQHCLYNSGIEQWYVHTLEFHFCYFFIKIENAVYISCQKSTVLFIHGFIFDIMNTQDNQSLEFAWKPMLAPLRSVNDQRFSWLHNIFLKLFQVWLNSVQKRQGSFERDASQNIFISSSRAANIWRIDENKHSFNHWIYPISSLTSG